MSGIGFESNK